MFNQEMVTDYYIYTGVSCRIANAQTKNIIWGVYKSTKQCYFQ